MSEAEFPLFPLGLVALPGELVPLHIFEERYKTMIAGCLEAESEFGIVWLADDGLRDIGCAMVIEKVLETMDDGRMDLVARGTRPFRVLERQGHLPYPAGVIEFVEDLGDDPDPDLVGSARAAYADLVRRATDREPESSELDAWAPTTWRRPSTSGSTPSRVCSTALRERAPAARHAAVPRRDQAAGLRRSRPGSGAVQRQGPVRLRAVARLWQVRSD